MTTARLIKKYANRRLYDASQSRHVTLEDIREFIMHGEKITVVEDKSGEDITRLILLQVIAEQEQFGKPILSTQLLESIIRYYGNGMHEFMSRYLTAASRPSRASRNSCRGRSRSSWRTPRRARWRSSPSRTSTTGPACRTP